MCFGFLILRKNWLCFAKITFMFSLPGNGGGVAPIFPLGGELVALMPILFGKIRIFSLWGRDSSNSTPFPSITGAGQRDEGRLSQPTADTGSFNFTEL